MMTAREDPLAGSRSSAARPTPTRRRQFQRDENLRKRAETELGRRTSKLSGKDHRGLMSDAGDKRLHRRGTTKTGTVASLQPAPPITLLHTANIVDAAQLMSAKRSDALLVVDSHQRLCGIMTDRDVAAKIVGDGLDPLTTKISEVMTASPVCVSTGASATDALSTMVTRHFRHLPVLDDEGDVVGMLDITKCLFDALSRMEKMDVSSRKLSDALETFEREFTSASLPPYVNVMRQKMLAPTLEQVTQTVDLKCSTLGLRSTVREAAKLMKETRSTAVLVLDQKGQLAGIFTSKDIVLRVVASKADPDTTSIIRVMTPRPDTIRHNNTVLDALKMMDENRYLHLPLLDDVGNVTGLADVLKLTHFVLQKLNSIDETTDNPMWNQFWNQGMHAGDTGSVMDTESQYSDAYPGDEQSLPSPRRSQLRGVGVPHGHVQPHDSVSQVSDSLEHAESSSTFVFKFRDPANTNASRVYRLTAPYHSLAGLMDMIRYKLGAGKEIEKLSYIDDDGDVVNMCSDADLAEAVVLARRCQWQRLMLLVNEQMPSGLMMSQQPYSAVGLSTAGSQAGSQAPSILGARDVEFSEPYVARSTIGTDGAQPNGAGGAYTPTTRAGSVASSSVAAQPTPVTTAAAPPPPPPTAHAIPTPANTSGPTLTYNDHPQPPTTSTTSSHYSQSRSLLRPESLSSPSSSQRRQTLLERLTNALHSDDPLTNIAVFAGSGATVGIALAVAYVIFLRTRHA